MTPELKQALEQKLLALADDEIILGHRDSEWTGHAPILEEDIALANLAQDEIGHAIIWYSILADLRGENPDTYPDQLVFFRSAAEYRNTQLVELPKGDWASTILRQYLYDATEKVRLKAMAESQYVPIAEGATKARKEEIYHYRHTYTWLQRLGLGTDESRQRMQNALNQLWPYTAQLFEPTPGEAMLVEAGYMPNPAAIKAEWEAVVLPALAEASLTVPTDAAPVTAPRTEHTSHLTDLLTEMQEVARINAEAVW